MNELLGALIESGPDLWKATLDTLLMVGATMAAALVLGTPLGVLLHVSAPGGLQPSPWLNRLVGSAVNVLRSFPFIILLAIHILVPIEIISNGHALINNDYNFDLINLSQNGVQSFAEVSSMAVEGVVNKYVRTAELFHDFEGASSTYMANNLPVLMNSAYEIEVQYQNSLNRSSYL